MTTPSHNDPTTLADWDFGDKPKPPVMPLRDQIAIAAMQALITKNGACHPADAYEMADAMMKAMKS